MKVTRTVCSKNLNSGKYAKLADLAVILGRLRSDVWHRYGSIAGVGKTPWDIRNEYGAARKAQGLTLSTYERSTIIDAAEDIKANREAAKVQARRGINRRTKDNAERKRLYTLLKSDKYLTDPYLHSLMRKCHPRGQSRTHNQIVLRSDVYACFVRDGQTWIKIPEFGKKPGLPKKGTNPYITIPLNTNIELTGQLRLILKDGGVAVHYCLDIEPEHTCGTQTLGIDKGYTEVFVDSDGDSHGEGLGELLRKESDYLKLKYQRRNKLRALAKNTKNERKRQNIIKNNLGRKKLDRRAKKTKILLRDKIFKATHSVVDKAEKIVAEDLTSPIKSSRRNSKNQNRRLAAWTKSIIAEALESVSHRRCSTVVHVNAAYTSQIDSRNGCLLGKRSGDQFHCFDGVVLQADMNAARNVLARLNDPAIGRYMPFTKVKSVLQERTERHRLRLSNPDPSGAGVLVSAGSELPAN